MSSFSHALALAALHHGEHKHTHVSRYVAEQLALQSSRSLESLQTDLNITLETGKCNQARHQSLFVNNIQDRSSEQHQILIPLNTSVPNGQEPSYQKRPRYKMRQDPMQLSKKLDKPTKAKIKGKSSRPKAGKTKQTKRVAETSVVLNDTTKKTRLTLKPHHNFGLFKNGRASAQIAIEKRGLPDLTFCEMTFLQGNNKNVKFHSGQSLECSGTPGTSLTQPNPQNSGAEIGPKLMSHTSITHLDEGDDDYDSNVAHIYTMQSQDNIECCLQEIDSDDRKHSRQIPNETPSNAPVGPIQEQQTISEPHGKQHDEPQRQIISSYNDYPLPRAPTEDNLETTFDEKDNAQLQTHDVVQTAFEPTKVDQNHQPHSGNEDIIGKDLEATRSSSPLSTLLRVCDDLIFNYRAMPFCGRASVSDDLAMHPTPTPIFSSLKAGSNNLKSQNGDLIQVPHVYRDECDGIMEEISSLDQPILSGDLTYSQFLCPMTYDYPFGGLDGGLPIEKEIQDDTEFDLEEAYILRINPETDDEMYSANTKANLNRNYIRSTTGFEGDDTVYTITAENYNTRAYGVEDLNNSNSSSCFENVAYFEPMESKEGLDPVPVHEMTANFNWKPYWRN